MDGLIIWSSALDWIVNEAQTEAFCRRFSPLPVVSVGRAFAGIPSVLVDNYQGMRDAVCHLIEHHGHRRIAFLRGPEGAQEEELRFRAYRDALTAHGLPLAAELISGHTNWERSDGPVAIADFLDTRGLRPKLDFDAIIAVGDDMACGALETLQARGVLVPEDVAVVGFNDDDEGRAILPALTTVRQPVEKMAQAAVSTLMALLSAQPAAELVTLPLELVVRRSCGCLSPGVLQAAVRASETPSQPVITSHAALVTQIVRATGASEIAIARLLADFQADLEANPKGAFLGTLNDLLQRDALADRDVSVWHAGLSVMRGGLLPALAATAVPSAEDLWQQGRVLVGETAAQAHAYQRFRAEQDTRLLGDLSQRIQTAAHRAALMDTLAAELPALGVAACYLALYEETDGPAQMARLLFAFDRHGVRELDPDAGLFPATQLLPTDMLPAEMPRRPGGAAAVLSESPARLHAAGGGCPRGWLHGGPARADQHGAGRPVSARADPPRLAGGRGRQPPQEPLPRHGEPRTAHPAQPDRGHHRNDAARGSGTGRGAARRPPPRSRQHPRQRPASRPPHRGRAGPGQQPGRRTAPHA